ncbi:MAG: MFS transporter [Sphingomonadales bacterium]|nr:MFS transporter [Sphingomonadales bacterium]
MRNPMRLLGQRRFLPLFVTQFLGAFNDNLFKTAMVVLVIYQIYSDPTKEADFAALASGLFILPFFLFSALSGQLADGRDKAPLIRIIKSAEIAIMVFGAAGLMLHTVHQGLSIVLMLIALFAMGVHSTFFGPIKYAILPQHLGKDDVLGGTGLVEAGTYIAILLGTIIGGIIPYQWAAVGVVLTAVAGRIAGQQVPPAPPQEDAPTFKFDWHIIRASNRLVSATMHIPRLYLAIVAISFFWAIGAVLAALFPPLVKNALGADQTVATMFMAIFSIGIAIGSVAVNRLLKGRVSARYSPVSAIAMGGFVAVLWWAVRTWPETPDHLMGIAEFVSWKQADLVLVALLGIAIAGGMFVVPLYAFLTTTVPQAETARTVAANNIVNSGAMVVSSLLLMVLNALHVTIADMVLTVAIGSLIAAWIAQKLHLACD